MEFRISRASLYNDDKPCEEAYKKCIIRKDERGFVNAKEFEDTCHEYWFVNINTLDDLLNFKLKYGDLIISDFIFNNEYKEIIIYDDYIE